MLLEGYLLCSWSTWALVAFPNVNTLLITNSKNIEHLIFGIGKSRKDQVRIFHLTQYLMSIRNRLFSLISWQVYLLVTSHTRHFVCFLFLFFVAGKNAIRSMHGVWDKNLGSSLIRSALEKVILPVTTLYHDLIFGSWLKSFACWSLFIFSLIALSDFDEPFLWFYF
jgi:hypothetical protein